MQAVISEMEEWQVGVGIGYKGAVLFLDEGLPNGQKYFAIRLPVRVADDIDVPRDFSEAISIMKSSLSGRDPYGIYMQSVKGLEQTILKHVEAANADS